MHSPIKFFAGSANRFSYKIIDGYNQAQKQMHLESGNPIDTLKTYSLGKSSFIRFSDGEFITSFDESVRGCTVFLIQSTFPPVDNLFELMLMVDAAKRASAYKVVAVIPYFGFARQDRKDQPRVAIGATADLLQLQKLTAYTMDLHADHKDFSMFLLTMFTHLLCLCPI